jgi:hypothetical protein
VKLGHWNSDKQKTVVDSFGLHIRKCKNYAAVITKDRNTTSENKLNSVNTGHRTRSRARVLDKAFNAGGHDWGLGWGHVWGLIFPNMHEVGKSKGVNF